MSIYVVEKACQFDDDFAHGIVTLESDLVGSQFPNAIEELGSVESRNKALGFAARQGVPDPRINGNPSGAYPVNCNDISLENVRDDHGGTYPPQHPEMQPARYRIDVPVCRKLI